MTDRAEAAVVEQIEVRLVRPEEEARWEELISQHHYLKSGRMVGEQLRYVAEYQGQWMALLGWIITSLTGKQADAARLLELVRQYWTIENGTHYPLDVSAGEDPCRVRHPVAATVLGILRRAVQGEARAWIGRQTRARDRTCPTFLAKMSRRLDHLISLITCPGGL